MDRPSTSCLLAHYITNSCYIIIPYFNSCACSCYPITINHQNKETDFSVWLCGILARLRKTGKEEEGEKRVEENKRERQEQDLVFHTGRYVSASQQSSRDPGWQQATRWALVWGAEYLLLPLQQSRSLPHSGLSFLCHRPSHSLLHPAQDVQQLSSPGASKPLPHTIACRPSPTAHDGQATTETLGQTSWCQLFDPDTKVKHSSNTEAIVLVIQC